MDSGDIDLIAHRIVHGGDLKKPSKITPEIKNEIKKFSELAPLHNPQQLMMINLCEHYGKPQYAVFDTTFFSNLPEIAKTYPIPKKIAKKYKIKRYGFHGLSHEYASRDLKGKTIICHLGSGSSISAVFKGKPIDTSMGFTPLDGIMMSTRSGAIDPGIIFFLEKRGYDAKNMLVEESGLKGICGYSEFKDILSKIGKDKNCNLAYDMFVYNIAKIIGAYAAALNGINNLVFTGKIGENSAKLRESVCEQLSFLGIKVNKEKNRLNSKNISSKKSKVKIFVVKTNEEKIIIEKLLKIL